MSRKVRLGIIGLAAALAIGLAAAAYVSHLEEDDRFCTSCHTAPEVAYYQRAQAALALANANLSSGSSATRRGGQVEVPDLSSAHYVKAQAPFRCIDCHRGDNGLVHRASTLALGAHDALVWLSGRADPSLEKNTAYAPGLLNTACTRCHIEALLITGFENHFHNKLPDAYRAWQAGGKLLPPRQGPPTNETVTGLKFYDTTVTCLDCHRAHVQAEEEQFFLKQDEVVLPACERCHRDVDRGPKRLRAP